MSAMSGPIVGISLLSALAAGTYAYMLHGELQHEKVAVSLAEQNLVVAKRATDEANRKVTATKLSLDTCNVQLSDTQSKLESAMSHPRKR